MELHFFTMTIKVLLKSLTTMSLMSALNTHRQIVISLANIAPKVPFSFNLCPVELTQLIFSTSLFFLVVLVTLSGNSSLLLLPHLKFGGLEKVLSRTINLH